MVFIEKNAEALSEYEIERGKPMPNRVHALVQKRLVFFLESHYGERFEVLPELTFELPSENATPDVALCAKEPIDLFDTTPREKEPPFGTIEIVSPSQSFSEFIEKAADYFAFGVQSCWVVLPAVRTIYVFKSPRDYFAFQQNDVLVDEKLGIEMPLAKIFG